MAYKKCRNKCRLLTDFQFMSERLAGMLLNGEKVKVKKPFPDDHSKNFSFLMDGKGSWSFAPVYDHTFSNSAYGFHSTMVAGESKNPGKKHLLELAKHFGIKKPELILEEVREAICQWSSIAKECGVSQATTKNIGKVMNEVNK